VTELIGGREPRPIVIAEYSDEWPRRFEAERARIIGALGDTARRVEHIGSTSVPGLAAKPIIDILVVVRDPNDERDFRAALEAAGYELRVIEDGHRMFRTNPRDVHIHIWGDGDPEIDDYLIFRDWLRESPDDRARYEVLKRELATRDWDDMNDYANAKGPLVAEIKARARAHENAL
jgi:GrpB-like predicted nucleotidyltransferase (UPF0157 family)